MTSPSPLRFFVALRLHAPYGLAALVCVTAISLWTVVLSPSELDSGLGMLLFVQMFLASSGFVPAARRGHFDPVLVRGRGRTSVAIAHWMVSVGPGGAAWLAIAITAYLFGSPAAESAMLGKRAAALVIVSAIAWSAGFAFTRGAAGLAWIGALVALLIRHVTLIAASDGFSVFATLRHAATLVLCPFLLIGPGPTVAAGSVPVAVVMSLGVLGAVWWSATYLDAPLGSAS